MSSFVVSSNAAKPPPKIKKPILMSSSSSLPLPDEISVICLAYVPRCDHPSLSLVSKTFHRLVTSSELKLVRSLHRCSAEHVLYLALGFKLEERPLWYTLNRKPYGNESNSFNHGLIPFPSFPSLPCWGSSVVAIGQEIYVLGGCANDEVSTNAFVIDCRFGTRRSLPSMRVARGCAAFGVVGGKIYVIGGCDKKESLDDWIEVFDLEKQTWERFSGLFNEELYKRTIKSFVMNEKIYIMDRKKSLVYDPKKNIWEREDWLNAGWQVGSCVIDNMLYTFGGENQISVYDPRRRFWSYLKGVEDLPDMTRTSGSRMANHGGKLAVLFKLDDGEETKIWCIEIALERQRRREIWGKILWSNLIITLEDSPNIVECLDVLS